MVTPFRQPTNWTPRETEAFFRDGIVPDEPPDVYYDPADLPDVFIIGPEASSNDSESWDADWRHDELNDDPIEDFDIKPNWF